MLYKCLIVAFVAILTIFLWNKETVFNKDDMRGRNVVITGASAGIGEELAYHYAKLGANVFITARRESLLKKVIETCKSLNGAGKFGYYAADMAHYKTESKIFIQKAVALLNGIDTLIVNHAYFGHLVVWHGSEDELKLFDKMSKINYDSYVYIVSHVLPYLKSAKQGRLGVVSSTAGKLPYPLAAIYAGSKFALDGFFGSIRMELRQAKTNVTVTLAVMGGVSTRGVADFFRHEVKRLQMTEADIVASVNSPAATPQEASKEIMKATETGIDELHFPPRFNTMYGSLPSSWVPILRGIWSTLLDFTIYSEDFYKKQESINLPRA